MISPASLGAGFEIFIQDLVNFIASLTGFSGRIMPNTSQLDGKPWHCPDISRAEGGSGFRAQVNLENGLSRTIDWTPSQERESLGNILQKGLTLGQISPIFQCKQTLGD
jgi:nucleoside-diphosphate-sugar epimerase